MKAPIIISNLNRDARIMRSILCLSLMQEPLVFRR